MRSRPAATSRSQRSASMLAVRGHREVLDAERFQPRDEILDAGAHQRLAARDANLANAHADEDARQALVFVPCEQLGRRHVRFRIGRAAIDAAEIAAVRDRDPQVGDLAAEFVGRAALCPLASPKTKSPNPRLDLGETPARDFGAPGIPLSKHGRPGRFHPNPQPSCCEGIASGPSDFSPLGRGGRRTQLEIIRLADETEANRISPAVIFG